MYRLLAELVPGSGMADMNIDLQAVEQAADSGKLNFPDLGHSADLMSQIDLTGSVVDSD